MKLITNEGRLPVGAPNPKWDDRFPHLIYPGAVRASDDFKGGATGGIAGRLTPIGGMAWANGVSGGPVLVGEDAGERYATSGASTLCGAVINLGTTDHEAMVRMRATGVSSLPRGAGVILRWADPNNFLVAIVRHDLGQLQIQERLNGAATALATAAFTAPVDHDIVLRSAAKGDVVRVAARDVTAAGQTVSLTFGTSRFNTATRAGLYTLSPSGLQHRLIEFYAG